MRWVLKMARRKKHRPGFEDLLRRYADSRLLDIDVLAGGQLRITDSGYIKIDVWTTGKYHIVQDNSHEITECHVISRQTERGTLPVERVEVGRFLDKLFFYAAALEERRIADAEKRNPNP